MIMPIKILCLGDIVGKPGRQVIAELLPPLLKERGIDFVVANAENSAAGSGLTPPVFEKLLSYGIDVCTLGDHAFRKRDILPVLEQSDRVIRPANYPPGAVGKGFTIVTSRGGVKIAVIQILGRMHMNPPGDDPFRTADRLLAELPRDVKVRIVEYHAEMSSEKIAMGWHVDGRASVNYGTHTHVPTADARVLPGGTAYVSDLGMTGPYDSVLGRRKDRVLKFLTTGMPAHFEVATGDPRMCGILATVDENSGLALSVERCDLKGLSLIHI